MLIDTLALADGEKNVTVQASDEPSASSGPRMVFVMRAGTTSAFQAFARPYAIR